MAHLANLAQICHGFGKYSKWMPKVAPWRVAIMTKIVKALTCYSNGESDESGKKWPEGWRKIK